MKAKTLLLRMLECTICTDWASLVSSLRMLKMNHVYCMPRQNSGRLLASSADFMHFSGCSGKVKVVNCKFAGAQDDCINVHGTNLRIMEKVNDYTLKLRFMHPQTYGFNAFFEGARWLLCVHLLCNAMLKR